MRRLYLETIGCQMNVLDSELVLGQLRAMGYEPWGDSKSAHLVVLNTCSVREHAEDKVYSRLGELRRPKRHRPEMIIGVIGCMAERDGDGILERCDHVDFLCGPGELHRVPGLITQVERERTRAVALADDRSRKTPAVGRALMYDSLEALDLSRAPMPGGQSPQAYVRVQRGCDKFCTFCVVPFTRGPERSRPPEHIVVETRRLVDAGAREVTLLGQTVNSFVHQENGRPVHFEELLARVHEVEGLERLRFITSYPGDFRDEVLHAMRDLPKLCPYLHLPAQSGSNAVLRRMRRQYTVEAYLDLVDRARDIVPGLTLAGDFIVGFPGETDAEFAETVALLERIRYKNVFVFKYSPRPGTAADRTVPDDVPDQVKRRRNTELLRVQERIGRELLRTMVGQTVEVLVEGYSKAAKSEQAALQATGINGEEARRNHRPAWRNPSQLTGRTPGDHIVVFDAPKRAGKGVTDLIGRTLPVEIKAATALTLHGDMVGAEKTRGVRALPIATHVGGAPS